MADRPDLTRNQEDVLSTLNFIFSGTFGDDYNFAFELINLVEKFPILVDYTSEAIISNDFIMTQLVRGYISAGSWHSYIDEDKIRDAIKESLENSFKIANRIIESDNSEIQALVGRIKSGSALYDDSEKLLAKTILFPDEA